MLEQQKLTEDNKSNIIIHALKPVEGITDTDQFLEIVQGCELSSKILSEDIISITRLGQKKDGQIQPLKIKLSSVDKKRELLRNLYKWRRSLESDRNRDPNEKMPQIDHDLTREQREERKSLVEIAQKKQAELPADSPPRIRVRGAPDNLKIVKIDSNRNWTVLDLNLLA